MKTARNSPCPCGSGLKYKRCHGNEVKLAEARQLAHEAFLQRIRDSAKPDSIQDNQIIDHKTTRNRTMNLQMAFYLASGFLYEFRQASKL